MTTTTQTEAQRLADAIDPGNEGSKIVLTIDLAHAAAELRRLDALVAGLEAVYKEAMGSLRLTIAENDQLREQLAIRARGDQG